MSKQFLVIECLPKTCAVVGKNGDTPYCPFYIWGDVDEKTFTFTELFICRFDNRKVSTYEELWSKCPLRREEV